AEDGIRDKLVTGVQTCALPIYSRNGNRLTMDAEVSHQGGNSSHGFKGVRVVMPVQKIARVHRVPHNVALRGRFPDAHEPIRLPRSEERRVGKEWRSRRAPGGWR